MHFSGFSTDFEQIDAWEGIYLETQKDTPQLLLLLLFANTKSSSHFVKRDQLQILFLLFSEFKGTLMQIWRSPYIYVYVFM